MVRRAVCYMAAQRGMEARRRILRFAYLARCHLSSGIVKAAKEYMPKTEPSITDLIANKFASMSGGAHKKSLVGRFALSKIYP